MSHPVIYINGKLHGKSDARISVYDHGLLYGDGVFEGIRVYSSRVFRLQEHIDRLYDSARSIALEIPMSRDEMIKATEETVAASKKVDGYIRLVVTRGVGNLGLDPRKCEPNVIIIVDDITLYPKEFYDDGLDIITAATIRSHPASLSPRVKSLNYLTSILAKIEAIRAGCFEAIMLNHNGEVAECTGDNLFVVKDGQIRTPPINAGILGGITRDVVFELAQKAGIELVEVTLVRHDVFSADEVFLSGTAAEIIPVVKCDGRLIGTGKPGPVFKQIRERYQVLVRG